MSACPVCIPAWVQVKDCDSRALAIFRRHYTYRTRRDQLEMFRPARNRNMKHFVGPGQKLVLLSSDGRALFVWRKFISMDAQTGVNCAVFRNEGSELSSLLIKYADDIAFDKWPGERHYTYVDTRKIRSSNPGYCFKMAGWRPCGWTKARGLLILERLP